MATKTFWVGYVAVGAVVDALARNQHPFKCSYYGSGGAYVEVYGHQARVEVHWVLGLGKGENKGRREPRKMKTYRLGVNKAAEVVMMLLQKRHHFSVETVDEDPRRYVTVETPEAVADVEALLRVI